MLCEQCHWYENEKPVKGCGFCLRLGFPEDILCSLIRNSCGEEDLLECKAYRHKLSLASPNQQSSVIVESENVDDSLPTDKEKYLIALSKQKLKLNADEIHFKLQFHVCLVTNKRDIMFSNKNKFIEEIIKIFEKIEAMFENTQIEVLHLDSDHIHLYVNTIPDYSLDEIAGRIISYSEKEITTFFLN